ncbi:hypothetical protein ARMSODRAFT_979212 [Armillaria solidipes]|uniref:Uncharacterized protein n=1 Tax=Armillaria solidipes TaxID=1076256 RepID=A0A2H3BEB3_9AGAR|nr:hypothetical protein ARMSODRAFT_979212 [Armillaria solidipes]
MRPTSQQVTLSQLRSSQEIMCRRPRKLLSAIYATSSQQFFSQQITLRKLCGRRLSKLLSANYAASSQQTLPANHSENDEADVPAECSQQITQLRPSKTLPVPAISPGKYTLDFSSTTDRLAQNGSVVTFGDVWMLQCGHMVDTVCAYTLLEPRRRVSLLRRPVGLPPPAYPIAKTWECPSPGCMALYRSVKSRGRWMMVPDNAGVVQALRPFAKSWNPSDPKLWTDVPRGTLSDLDAMGMSIRALLSDTDIYRGPRLGILPWSMEYMTTLSRKLEPPVAVSVSSTVIPLLNSVKRGFMIDTIVAETLVSCPAVPPEWRTYLKQFSTPDEDDNNDESLRALVLVAPKMLQLGGTAGWIPVHPPTWKTG